MQTAEEELKRKTKCRRGTSVTWVISRSSEQKMVAGLKLGQQTTSLYSGVLRKLLLLREKEEDPLHLESFKHQLRGMMSGVRLQFQENGKLGIRCLYQGRGKRFVLEIKMKYTKTNTTNNRNDNNILFQLQMTRMICISSFIENNLQAVASSYAFIIVTFCIDNHQFYIKHFVQLFLSVPKLLTFSLQ